MAVTLRQHDPIQFHKLPTSQYVSSIRFLPSLSPFTRHLLLSLSSSSASPPSLQLFSLSLSQTPALIPLSNFTLSSPTTSLSPHPSLPFLAFSTSSSLHFLTLDSNSPSFHSHFSPHLDVVARFLAWTFA
ncbi:hypothetical protein MLD38_014497 [Melastoma candidum]|uniref:Uncharacterized protein n=1 Tax=Melastoma candidum TaxID=119954 RepID=A0ACB9RD38_9MYRT|nr:hypothetical protein MLD38_014497 [Melastoma candidum]